MRIEKVTFIFLIALSLYACKPEQEQTPDLEDSEWIALLYDLEVMNEALLTEPFNLRDSMQQEYLKLIRTKHGFTEEEFLGYVDNIGNISKKRFLMLYDSVGKRMLKDHKAYNAASLE